MKSTKQELEMLMELVFASPPTRTSPHMQRWSSPGGKLWVEVEELEGKLKVAAGSGSTPDVVPGVLLDAKLDATRLRWWFCGRIYDHPVNAYLEVYDHMVATEVDDPRQIPIDRIAELGYEARVVVERFVPGSIASGTSGPWTLVQHMVDDLEDALRRIDLEVAKARATRSKKDRGKPLEFARVWGVSQVCGYWKLGFSQTEAANRSRGLALKKVGEVLVIGYGKPPDPYSLSATFRRGVKAHVKPSGLKVAETPSEAVITVGRYTIYNTRKALTIYRFGGEDAAKIEMRYGDIRDITTITYEG